MTTLDQKNIFIHESAIVENDVVLGEGTKVWAHAQIRRGARIGKNCQIGKGVFIDHDVVIGDACKFQNYACVYHGADIGNGVFVGPHVVFTNDLYPRSVDRQFNPLEFGEWTVGKTSVLDGAAIGANSTILPGVAIGAWALIGAGTVLTKSVPAYHLFVGQPGRFLGYVCRLGHRVTTSVCTQCGEELENDHPVSFHH